MALQDYAVIKLFYNGAPVTQITRISRVLNANNQPIQVLGEGLAGFTDGSGECTIEWDCPIPIGGTEFDYEGDAAAKNFVDLQVFVGSRSYAGRGKLQTTTTGQEQGAAANCAVSWAGEFKAAAA